MTIMIPPTALLFDLDGTLLDTAGDFGHALNRLLIAHNHPEIALEKIRLSVGHGSKALLKLGMNIEKHHPYYEKFIAELLDYYEEHLSDTTTFFPGMENVLAHLDEKHIPWGIVTNKPTRFTHKLLSTLSLTERAHCIISGDTLSERKPHPAPILEACRLIKHAPARCLYVGDAEIDIIASKAAGTLSAVALYGYIAPSENPKDWQADNYINHPQEIFSLL